MDLFKPPSIGKNILHYRKEKNLSIDELSTLSGVSKSMLSQIEQEKTNPTVLTVWKIATSLNIGIEKVINSNYESKIEVIREKNAPIFYSKDKLFILKIITPIYLKDNLELYYLICKPSGKNKSKPHFRNSKEFITIISGELKITAGNSCEILLKGDTGLYKSDQEHIIENVTELDAEAFIAVWFPK